MGNYDKAIRFAFHAIALSLIIMGIIQAYAPYMGGPDPRAAEIKQVMGHIIPVSPGDVPSLLHDKEGKPVMLVLYASWCGPCMLEMPRIMDLMREGRLNGVKPVFISLDHSVYALSAYLVHRDYYTLFPNYLFEYSLLDLQDVLKAAGSGFNRHIPYIGFFDKQGKLVAEHLGMTDDEELIKIVNKL